MRGEAPALGVQDLRAAPAIGEAESGWLLSSRGELDRDDLLWLGATLEDPARFDALSPISRSRNSSVARAELSCGPVVLKRYRFDAALRLRTFGRRSLAQREADAMSLVAAVLPENPVRVLAWAESRHAGMVSAAAILTTDFVGSIDLRQVKRCTGSERRILVDAVLRRLPALVARLHAGRIFARTLRGKNVLLRPARERFALIDLPRASRIAPRLAVKHRLFDLACLSIELRRFLTPEQWESFVRSYCHEAGITPPDRARLSPACIESLAARIDHRTPMAATRRRVTRRFRRGRVGTRLLGRSDPAGESRPDAG